VSRGKEPSKKAKPKRIERKLRIPRDELTPEEQRNVEGVIREEKRRREQEKVRGGDFNWAEARRTIDRANAVREGLIPPPWAAKQGKTGRSKGESDVDRLNAWLAELYAHDEWQFLPATTVHRDITARAQELTIRSGKRVPGLSYTAVREGLKEKRKSRKTRKTQK
jgi:hypothetical protein